MLTSILITISQKTFNNYYKLVLNIYITGSLFITGLIVFLSVISLIMSLFITGLVASANV
jgi:hypothetical protein